ncbi:transmembrane sensor [Catalinimonas alkaloidigena]|uniref:FecR family protein n=1 Tax=Catalinimonas alkaloidigena TaxID=1075417 RepID=UPI0024065124|nr:FecR domain-containing protein [Catalinimonas alkaloidigena]MDF9796398.1 transmembrane sensor [Catalinimonas alkaloidigena]
MKNHHMNYQSYAIEDFLLDKKFRDWVEHPHEDLDVFWNDFLSNHPEKAEELMSAKEILQKMKFKKHSLSADEVSDLLAGIHKGKDKAVVRPAADDNVLPMHPAYSTAQTNNRTLLGRRRTLSIAASISLLFMFTALILWLSIHTNEEVYATAYGETKPISLPDGSLATLNANSSLRFPSAWNDREAREVWLEGEAFFEVKKISQNDNLKSQMPYKFVVHTDGVAIEVLGTEFNVNTRREKVQVVLNSGKVRLKWQEKEMLMQPGELIEVSKKGSEVAQRIVKPETYSSWKENHLLCDATTLREIAQTIEDRFGYEVVFQDRQLSQIEVSGTIPLDNMETFELVISRLINVHFELKGNKLLISK